MNQPVSLILSDAQIAEFQETLWRYFDQHGRSMPWRDEHAPYNVLVSELMLQQTQVARVIPKYLDFMAQFPDVATLARVPLSDVLVAWQGLGYNRRAKYLHEAAKMVVDKFGGSFPETLETLVRLPGVGKNTAGAIMAYAYDTSVVFIETNVRTVFFHHFFADAVAVSDKELATLVQQTLPSEHIREWYWAMMDYGSHLKQTAGGRLDTSAHYKKQSPLKGSVREVRGQIVRELSGATQSEKELRSAVSADDRFETALAGLIRDGLVARVGERLGLTA